MYVNPTVFCLKNQTAPGVGRFGGGNREVLLDFVNKVVQAFIEV